MPTCRVCGRVGLLACSCDRSVPAPRPLERAMQISPPQISWSPGRDHHHNQRPRQDAAVVRERQRAYSLSPPRTRKQVEREVRTLAQGLGDLLIADETLQRGEPVTPGMRDRRDSVASARQQFLSQLHALSGDLRQAVLEEESWRLSGVRPGYFSRAVGSSHPSQPAPAHESATQTSPPAGGISKGRGGGGPSRRSAAGVARAAGGNEDDTDTRRGPRGPRYAVAAEMRRQKRTEFVRRRARRRTEAGDSDSGSDDEIARSVRRAAASTSRTLRQADALRARVRAPEPRASRTSATGAAGRAPTEAPPTERGHFSSVGLSHPTPRAAPAPAALAESTSRRAAPSPPAAEERAPTANRAPQRVSFAPTPEDRKPSARRGAVGTEERREPAASARAAPPASAPATEGPATTTVPTPELTGHQTSPLPQPSVDAADGGLPKSRSLLARARILREKLRPDKLPSPSPSPSPSIATSDTSEWDEEVQRRPGARQPQAWPPHQRADAMAAASNTATYLESVAEAHRQAALHWASRAAPFPTGAFGAYGAPDLPGPLSPTGSAFNAMHARVPYDVHPYPAPPRPRPVAPSDGTASSTAPSDDEASVSDASSVAGGGGAQKRQPTPSTGWRTAQRPPAEAWPPTAHHATAFAPSAWAGLGLMVGAAPHSATGRRSSEADRETEAQLDDWLYRARLRAYSTDGLPLGADRWPVHNSQAALSALSRGLEQVLAS